MNRLFELFVAEWLAAHLPKTHSIKAQEHVEITASGDLEFIVDLVLYDAVEDRPLCVLDTKYKRPKTPAAGDIEQVVAYAVSKQCTDAALVYPLELKNGLDTCVGGRVNVRSLSFALNGDLDEAGAVLVTDLVSLE
jgi:5-methylcytosine-specific restriction endonuclease McrBC regulatory subunit McrC